MLSKKDQKKIHFLIQVAFIAVIVSLIFLAFRYVLGVITPFIIALIVASLVDPLVQTMNKKLRIPRSIASTVSIVLLLACLIGLGTLLSRTIWVECKEILSGLPVYLNNVIKTLKTTMIEGKGIFNYIPDAAIEDALEYLSNYDYKSLVTGSLGGTLIGYAGNAVFHIPNALVFFIVTVVSSVFMSASFPIVKSFILAQFSGKIKELIIFVKKDVFKTVGKYLISYSLLMFITFVELFVFFLIFDFDSPLTLAFLIAIVDILPILGVGTVLIPWSLISLLTGSPIRALILICMYIVITIVRQVLEPKVIGDHVGMLPLLTLFCIWVGLKLFGFVGIFAVPITVVVLKNLQESGKINLWKNPVKKDESKGEDLNGNE